MTDVQKNQLKASLVDRGFTETQIDNSIISSTGTNNTINVSVPVYAKQFIQNVLITELSAVVKISPWLGFISISSGIEFLGKCIDNTNPNDWNAKSVSSANFNDAIKNLNSFSKYRPLLTRPNFNLYSGFRCGLVHACAPNDCISLSHGSDELGNLVEQSGIINFNADELCLDFKSACEEVINMNFPEPNKMNVAKIFINFKVI